MADVIGRAIIEVAPDTKRFSERLTRDLRKISSSFKKVSVGVSVGSASKAFREFTKLNLALRAATAGFAALAVKSAAAGLLLAADAAVQLSGALGVIPAAGAAAAIAVGTLKIGLFGVDDAFKAFLKGDMNKFNEKLKDLSPNAQQVLGLLKEFRPALLDFKNSVQDALFEGLEKPLRAAATTLLPILKKGFVGIADEFNLLGKRLVAFSTSAQTVADVQTVFGNVKDAFHALVPAGEAVARAIRDIVAVGSKFLPQIAAVIQLVAERFASFIANARESGALEDFFARGLAALAKLVGALVDVAKGIGGIFRAASDSGLSFLDIFADLARKFKEFTTSVGGQNALGHFFDNAERAIGALFPVLAALGRLFNDQIVPIITQLAITLAKPLATFIDAIGKAFEAAEPGINAFAKGVGKFLEGIAPALPAIGKLAGTIGTLLGGVLERIAPVLERVIGVLAEQFTKVLSNPKLVDGIGKIAEAFGNILIAIAPIIEPLGDLAIAILPGVAQGIANIVPVIQVLVPVIQIAIKVIEKFIEVFLFFLDLVGAAPVPITHFVESAQHDIVDRLPGATLGAIGSFAHSFFATIALEFGKAADTVDETMDRIVRTIFGLGPGIGEAGSALGKSFTAGLRSTIPGVLGAAQDLVNGVSGVLNNTDFGPAGAAVSRSFARGIRAAINAVIEASRDVAGAAGSALPRSPAKVGPLSGRGWTPFRGRKLTEGFAEGMLASIDKVRFASTQLARSSATALGGGGATSGASGLTTATTTPNVVVTSGATSVTTGGTDVRVFIDGRELRGVVVEVVDERDRQLRRRVQAGAGGAR